MLGASGRYIPTAVVVAAVVVVVAAEGAAAAFRPGVAPAAAIAAVLLLAVLLGGPEELEGLSAHRLVVIGGGVDLLFRGGVDSVRRGVFLIAVLRLLLEQELEVIAFSLGLVVFGGYPEVELLCILVQRSERLVHRRRVVLRRRFPTFRNGVEGGGRED